MSDRDWLTRNVRVLSAVSFLQDAASELLYPLLPIYLTADQRDVLERTVKAAVPGHGDLAEIGG